MSTAALSLSSIVDRACDALKCDVIAFLGGFEPDSFVFKNGSEHTWSDLHHTVSLYWMRV